MREDHIHIWIIRSRLNGLWMNSCAKVPNSKSTCKWLSSNIVRSIYIFAESNLDADLHRGRYRIVPWYMALSVLWMYHVNEQFHFCIDRAYAAYQ